jgi:poly-gamma-glutamate synthesis protein (capsule biosynthesis protein)
MKNFNKILFFSFWVTIVCFSTSEIYAQQFITLLFAGDAMQHQKQIDNALRDSVYDYSECFKYVKDEISALIRM